MTVKECYDLIGGDYEDVISRLGSDDMIRRFLPKLLKDNSYALLCSSLQERNVKEAFMAAHTLKGICQNMSLTRLCGSVIPLTEELRDREEYGEELEPLLERVREAYIHTSEGIEELLKEE